MSQALSDAFRYSKLVLATTTYNAGIYPFMNDFITRLAEHNFQNRTVGLIENGSWAPLAAKVMKNMLSECKKINWLDTTVKATLSVRGALRCGAGLVTAAIPRSIYPMVTVAQPEAVCLPLPDNDEGQRRPEARERLYPALAKATALLVGCGLGQGEEATALVLDLLERATCPMVLDADGINAVCAHIDKLKAHEAPLILTPHPGEMARLCHTTVAEVESDRIGTARRFAADNGVWVVLKGHRTIIASPNRALLVNPTGNPGMATGGSGDVLAGMIASFAAQGMAPLDAAMCAVYLHGRAGDHAAERLGQHAMLPSDLLDDLGPLLHTIENRS